jgi:leader peptidase (prepilin peptidase)/N-methyltransferase
VDIFIYFAYIAVFIVGLLVGSFLNVCIYRVPRRKSIVSPPSACPNCGSKIKPWHNIPVLSYILLGGRCAYCGAGISVRYPLIELLNALLYVATLYRFGVRPSDPYIGILPMEQSFLIMALISAFIVVTFIDLEHQIIPDGITLPGIVLGLILGPLVLRNPAIPWHTGFVNSLLGMVVGGGAFYIIAVLSRGGMGGGDIKLIAMIGAFLGWEAVLLTIFVGSLFGAVVGIWLMVFKGMKRKTPIPFGPFLVAGAMAAIFCGPAFLSWYGRLPY